jgi:hypothetical protein
LALFLRMAYCVLTKEWTKECAIRLNGFADFIAALHAFFFRIHANAMQPKHGLWLVEFDSWFCEIERIVFLYHPIRIANQLKLYTSETRIANSN